MKCKHGLLSQTCAYCTKLVRETSERKRKRVTKPAKAAEVGKIKGFLETLTYPMEVNETLCVGCMKPTKVAFMRQGSVFVGMRFIDKVIETEELKFDGSKLMVTAGDKLVDLEVIERISQTIPVGERRRGWICLACQQDHKTREVKHQDGSTSWEPVVLLKPSVTEHTTLNPGWSREDALSTIPLHYDSLGFVMDEEIHYPSYNKFARGR